LLTERDRFKYIFHIDGTDTLTASQSYANICQEHALGGGTTNEMKNVTLRWIDGLSDEWLMIYDNCPEQERFRPVIPSRSKGNIIYTSRSQGFQADIPAEFAREVKPFEEDDAIDMLLKIAGHEQLRSDAEELKSAQEIVAAVGYLPLAIESAGAYLREGGCNALTYLQRFHDRHVRPELLSSPNSDAFSPVVPALYTALNLSYEAISAVRLRKGRSVVGTAAEYALKALNLLCFYHNEKIPVLMLERAATERLKWGSLGVCPLSDLAEDRFTDEPGARFINATDLLSLSYPEGTWDNLSFDLGVQTLQRFSLVKLSPNRRHVSMHVMVQDWAIHKMNSAARERQALAARMVLIESMTVSWNRQEISWMRLIPSHVKACLSHKATPVTHDPYQAILDYKLGWYYAEEKQFPKAVEHLRNALRIWKFENGVYSESVTVALLDLGKIYHEMGRASDAELAYLEVLERLALRFADIGTEDRRCRARAKARLRRRAKHEGLAHLLPRREAEERKEAEDEETEDEQDDSNNSTVTMDAPGAVMGQNSTPQHGRAPVEQWIEDVLSVVKREPRQYTPDDLGFELASASTELARLYFDQGSFEPGAQLVLKAMEHLKQCGEPHDIRLWALEDELVRRFRQGGDLRHWARRTSALRAFPKDVFEDAAAHDYSFVWQVGYACYLANEESWEEAYRAFARVMDLAPIYYGLGDRRTLYLMRKMALCQLETGLFEEAEALARTAIERAKTSYGQSHLHTAKCLDTLSIIMMCQTFDLHPGSEFWSVTEEAYDSARPALPDGHYLTVRLKRRLDMFRTPKPRAVNFLNRDGEEKTESSLDDKPQPIDGGKTRNAEGDNFFEYMDELFAKGEPDTEEEYTAIVNAEYREFTRRKLVAKAEAKKSRKSKPPVTAKAEPSSDVDNSSSSSCSNHKAESEAAETKDSTPSRRERKEKWKGKEKADVSLSPILERGPSFRWEVAQGPPDMIEEALGEESRSDVKGKGKALPMPRSDNHVLSGEGTSRSG
jgi:tetratricopeptide (TPR) repeat protein